MLFGIKTLLLAISVNLTQAVYPMIPRLYNLFMYFANFQFLSSEFVEKIWNNIYVLVTVIVMFAIAIKLISAMVNPNTLTENKKGVTATYIRTVIAVILIFIFPILIKVSVSVQTDLLKDNFLITRVFGVDINNNDAGQYLAWETFSSFCKPVDSSTGNGLDTAWFSIEAIPQSIEEYNRVEQNIDQIQFLDFELFLAPTIFEAVTTSNIPLVGVAIGDKINVGFEYHSILCPLAGILVAYELLLLCMDTIFRAAKLAVLQLMLPIVLGAFVFNPDVLKKWGKEYISTFLSVFLKVLAIGFMIIILNELKGVVF